MAVDDQPATKAGQLSLIAGVFRCDDCGALVERLHRTRRFRLCDACYERVVPVLPEDGRIVHGSPVHEAIRRYWEWFEEMEKRVPRRREPGHNAKTRRPGAMESTSDRYYPLCACGRPREPLAFGGPGCQRGLFGGPFAHECPVCEARHSVESHYRGASSLHPDWDDETWLDLLYRVMPRAFELGVLPGYWFALRYPGIVRQESPHSEPVDRWREGRGGGSKEAKGGTERSGLAGDGGV